MSGWVIWVIVACACGIGEMLTTSFFLAPFAGGAAVAAVVSLAGAGGLPAWIAFVVVSLLALGVVRPIAISHLQTPPQLRTGAAAMIGKRAIVVERIDNDEGVGCIRVDGEVWTARSLGEDERIEPGTRVEIVEIRGATALVIE